MTETTADPAAVPSAPAARTPPLFVVAVFTSAALVFMVQPMVAKLVLPMLGGSPAVWNTSMAFFQAALLVGYGYAHVLQKLPTVRRQIIVHIVALALAGLTLPLRVSGLLGDPSSTTPNLWLLGVLALSIGLPFAILSATAPLVQAWYARTRGQAGGEPYALYAASNLGSLLALLAYPVLMEPLMTLQAQRWSWSGGYLAFVLILASLAVLVWRSAATAGVADISAPAEPTPAPRWRDRLTWIALAALPSSLMLGVTTHLATDVASAPFLWVAPLALYLLTFIIAFQTRPLVSPHVALLLQAAALPACIFLAPLQGNEIPLVLLVNLAAFFLSALVCHQALVARRPDPSHLTEFYLCLSVGGVVGGAFNAFLAPQMFDWVLEYPLALVLVGLARPWGRGKLSIWEVGVLATGAVAAVAVILLTGRLEDIMTFDAMTTLKALLAATLVSAFLLRGRGLVFTLLLGLLAVSAHILGDRAEVISTERSFFGVLRQTRAYEPRLDGEVRLLAHGTTLHGAQAKAPQYRCRPLVYYAPETPIGQVFETEAAMKPALRVGAVGLGTGSVAAYNRAGDHLTFFEIDPLVVRIAHESGDFTYTTQCARGRVDFVLGDARLTLDRQPAGTFDVLLLDAFSSDAIPGHLMTVEAVREYLSKLKPDGVLIMHLSNRHLELRTPAMAVARAAGGYALLQRHQRAANSPNYWESGEDVLIVARSPAALAAYEADDRWTLADSGGARPWTDDYINLVGALYGRLKERWEAE
ncbi:fused MFS/spermidine synthase [Caulobacter mirabilis]|uniref:Spermidine synthase n=1 Tax=Caulobacter mirabilis TaxID=69666 RepID=A0A2D2AYC9_9CAUL|nr:fused MFS/spermidine synthase [Caulobacter mirabilis]ATQ42991.1 spermidine synthase [Caulobacter mirabilis]